MNAHKNTPSAPPAQNILARAQELVDTPAALRTLGWHIAAAHLGHVSAVSAMTARG